MAEPLLWSENISGVRVHFRSHARLTARSAPGCERGFSIIEMLVVVAVITIMAGMAIPFTSSSLEYYRLSGDARSLSSGLGLAKLRAASAFSRTRLYLDLSAKSYHIETWQKAGNWSVEAGGSSDLSRGVSFGFDPVATAPPDTQATISQAPECLDDAGDAVEDTACILFNSRGIPVDTDGAPTAADAIYVTNGTFVYGISLSANGLSKVWRANAAETPNWAQQ
jgi:prepilin-type N-terminal cleavage/methylation domain-containing protein